RVALESGGGRTVTSCRENRTAIEVTQPSRLPAEHAAGVTALRPLHERVEEAHPESCTETDAGAAPDLAAAFPIAGTSPDGGDDRQDERHADLARESSRVYSAVAPLHGVDEKNGGPVT